MGPAAFSCMAPPQPARRQLEPISFTEIRLEVDESEWRLVHDLPPHSSAWARPAFSPGYDPAVADIWWPMAAAARRQAQAKAVAGADGLLPPPPPPTAEEQLAGAGGNPNPNPNPNPAPNPNPSPNPNPNPKPNPNPNPNPKPKPNQRTAASPRCE